MRTLLVYVCLLLNAVSLYSQGYSYYENSQFDPFQRHMYVVGNNKLHSSVRSYKLDELRVFYDLDSLIYDGIRRPYVYLNNDGTSNCKPVSSNIFKNLIHDDFLAWKSNDIYVSINPYFDFTLGKADGLKTYINSRGFYVNGNLGKNFSFYIDFTENQALYPRYYNEIVESVCSVPGQSNYRGENEYYDFQVSNGYIGFNVGQYVDFQLGKGKTFIGDGYRSLLLSDAACAYPYLKMNVTFMNVKYMLMMSQLSTGDAQRVSNNGFRTKYSFTHYLDWNLWGRFSIGMFENVTMASWRKTGETRHPDWEYIVPLVVFRAGEYNAGSPDKMLVGINYKLLLGKGYVLHGQVMFNEFRLKELTAGNGYWSNKYGYLFGLKCIDLFGAKGLDLQLEYSQARPFCYSQYDGMATYTDHKQSLAHPLGANFKEFVALANYKYNRLALHAQVNLSKYGDDIPGDTLSYGHNPNIASVNRNANYGVEILQGNKTSIKYIDMSASLLINPRSRLNLTAGLRFRNKKNDYLIDDSRHYYVALRWSLKNHYFDY